MKTEFNISPEIRNLLTKKSNSLCADCFDSCAIYVDIDNCIFLCKSCAEVHEQLGFHIKNPSIDTFTDEEIQKLTKTDNELFNETMMSEFNLNPSKIPFGASEPERMSFIEEKYITKKWFSPIPNKNNKSFYNPRHFEIQKQKNAGEEEDKTDSDLISDTDSETTDITSPVEPNFFGLHQKENEILDTSNMQSCDLCWEPIVSSYIPQISPEFDNYSDRDDILDIQQHQIQNDASNQIENNFDVPYENFVCQENQEEESAFESNQSQLADSYYSGQSYQRQDNPFSTQPQNSDSLVDQGEIDQFSRISQFENPFDGGIQTNKSQTNNDFSNQSNPNYPAVENENNQFNAFSQNTDPFASSFRSKSQQDNQTNNAFSNQSNPTYSTVGNENNQFNAFSQNTDSFASSFTSKSQQDNQTNNEFSQNTDPFASSFRSKSQQDNQTNNAFSIQFNPMSPSVENENNQFNAFSQDTDPFASSFRSKSQQDNQTNNTFSNQSNTTYSTFGNENNQFNAFSQNTDPFASSIRSKSQQDNQTNNEFSIQFNPMSPSTENDQFNAFSQNANPFSGGINTNNQPDDLLNVQYDDDDYDDGKDFSQISKMEEENVYFESCQDENSSMNDKEMGSQQEDDDFSGEFSSDQQKNQIQQNQVLNESETQSLQNDREKIDKIYDFDLQSSEIEDKNDLNKNMFLHESVHVKKNVNISIKILCVFLLIILFAYLTYKCFIN